jgi:gliding motility-associated-like protein
MRNLVKKLLDASSISMILMIILWSLPIENLVGQCTVNAGENRTICQGSSVTLTAVPSGNTSTPTYQWMKAPIAGGVQVNCGPTTASITETPTVSTRYTVTLIGGGCLGPEDVVDVFVVSPPSSEFTVTPSNSISSPPFANQSFSFNAETSGATYLWDFGDPESGSSNTSTAKNPSHTFKTGVMGCGNKDFNVSLTVTKDGCSSTVTTHPVRVKQIPDVTLTTPGLTKPFTQCLGSNPTSTLLNLVVQYSPLSGNGSCNNTRYQIDWGDGTPQYDSPNSPNGLSHTYGTIGSWTLVFTVTGNYGGSIVSNSKTYNVFNGTNPAIALGSSGSTQGCTPYPMSFTTANWANNAVGTIYEFYPGDGTGPIIYKQPGDNSSSYPELTNPLLYTYHTTSCGNVPILGEPNTFLATIRAVNPCSSTTAAVSGISVSTPPTASFTVSSHQICVGGSLTVTNTSTPGCTAPDNNSTPTYTWNWGDGQTSTGANPGPHTYTNFGNYTITLTANQCSSSTATQQVCVGALPVPTFTLPQTSSCAPLTTTFNNTTNETNLCSPVNYEWVITPSLTANCSTGSGGFEFKDGTTLNSKNPKVEFTKAGTYNIVLKVANGCGPVSSTAQTITIKDKPVVSITAPTTGTSLCAGGTLSPTASFTVCNGTISNYTWTITNGTPTSATTASPGTITFNTPGTATIKVKASNECGMSNEASVDVTVKPVPVAVSNPTTGSVCSGQSFSGFTFSTNPNLAGTIFNWAATGSGVTPPATSGNGSISNVTYNNTGTSNGTVTYTVTPSLNGCTGATISPVVTVKPLPSITANPANQTICSGGTTQKVTLNSNITSGTTYTLAVTPNSNVTGLLSGGALTGNEIAGHQLTLASGVTTQQTVTYTVTPSNNSCNGSSITITYTINPLPIFSAQVPSSKEICSGESVNISLEATPSSTFNWTASCPTSGVTGFNATGSGATINDVIVNSTASPATVTYTITPVSSLTSCSGAAKVITVSVKPKPSLTFNPQSQTICSGVAAAPINITSTVTGTTYNWTGSVTAGTAGSFTTSGTTSTINAGTIVNLDAVPATVTYEVTPNITGCSYSTKFNATIQINPAPGVSNTSLSQSVCSGGSTTAVTLNGTLIGTTFNWTATSNPSGQVTGFNATGTSTIPVQTLVNTGLTPATVTYHIIPSSGPGCQGVASDYVITVKPKPTATATPATQDICSNSATQSIALSSNVTGTTFAWTGAAGSSIQLPSSLASGSVTPIPSATGITNSGTTTGTATFTITPTADGCPGSSVQAVINVKPIPVLTLTPATTQQVCSGTNTTQVDFSSNVSGTTFNYALSGTPTGVTGTLSAGTNATNLPAHTLTNSTNAVVPVTYSVTPTAATCPGSAKTVTIQVKPKPAVANTEVTKTICSGESTNIALTCSVATGTPTYSWTTECTTGTLQTCPSNGTGVTINNTLVNTGTGIAEVKYHVTVTVDGCTSEEKLFTVSVRPVPVITFSPTPQTICSGTAFQTVNLSGNSTPSSSVSFTWTAQASSPSITGFTASQNTPGQTIPGQTLTSGLTTSGTVTYTVVPRYESCSYPASSSNYVVTVNPAPSLTNTSLEQTICNNTSSTAVTLTGNVSGTTFSWSAVSEPVAAVTGFTASGTNATLPASTLVNSTNALAKVVYTITPAATGLGSTCQGAIAHYTVNVQPTPVGSATGLTQTLCNGASSTPIALSSTVTGTSFTWSATSAACLTGYQATGSTQTTIPSATIQSTCNAPSTVNYTITPTIGSPACSGTPLNAVLTVQPLVVLNATQTELTQCSGVATSIAFTSNVASDVMVKWVATLESGTVTGFSSQTTAIAASSIAQTLTNAGTANGVVKYVVTPYINDCPGTPKTFTVTVKPSPVLTLPTSPQEICSGGTTNIALNSGVTGTLYSWTISTTGSVNGASASTTPVAGPIAQTLTLNDQSVGSVTYTITPSAAGCNGSEKTFLVNVNPNPVATASTSTPNIAYGTQATLTGNGTGGTGSLTYTWTPACPNTVLQSCTGQPVTTQNLTSPTTFTLHVTDSKGCSSTSDVTVSPTGDPLSVVIAANPVSVCAYPNPSVTLTATPSGGSGTYTQYNWESYPAPTWTQTTTANTVNVAPTISTQYRVKVNDGFNTAWSAPVSVTINPLPTAYNVTVTNQGHYCSGGTGVEIGLSNSQSGTGYQLKKDGVNVGTPAVGTGSAINFGHFTEAGIYTVEATSTAGCINMMTGSVTVIIDPLPVANAGVDKTIPYGTWTSLAGVAATSGTSPYSYQWTPAASIGTGATTLTPQTGLLSAATTFTLTVTDSRSCTDTDDAVVDITGTGLALECNASPAEVCNDNSPIQLSATPSGGDATKYSFSWTGPNGWTSTSQNPTYTPAGGLTAVTQLSFTVTLSDTYTTKQCTSTITVNPLPTSFDVTGGGGYCSGSTPPNVGLSSSQVGVSYQLKKDGVNDGSPITGTGSAISFGPKSEAAQYSVVATSTKGCIRTMAGNAVVTIWPLPVSDAGPDFSINYGMTQQLTGSASGGTTPYQTFAWSPAAQINGSATSANPTGNTFAITTKQLYANQTYTFTVTDAHGCTGNNIAEVQVGGDPLSVLPSATPNAICLNGGTIQLNAQGSGGAGSNISGFAYTYSWTSVPAITPGLPNVANPVVNLTTPGTYTFTVTVNDGYSTANASVNVTVHPLPQVFSVTGGGEYCAQGVGLPIGLSGSQSGVNYQLFLGTNAVGPIVAGSVTGAALDFGLQTAAGSYSVVATNAATSCINTMGNPVSITINPLPVVNASATTPIAHGISTDLFGTATGGTGALSYAWTPSDKVATGATALNAHTTNLYGNQIFTFTATDTKGCSAFKTTEVVVSGDPLSVLADADPAEICQGTSVQLTANGAGGSGTYTYHWTAGTWSSEEQNPTVSPNTTTTYTVTVDDGYNTATATAVVLVNALPTLYNITQGGEYCEGGVGIEIKMLNSQQDISYVLYKDGAATTTTVTGTGGPISFGNMLEAGDYTVKAVNTTTTCSRFMDGTSTVIVNPLPQVYLVTGGGQYPSGGVGVPVGLSGSETGINYMLYLAGQPLILPPGLPGTGSAITFGNQTLAGQYTVMAVNPVTGCEIQMNGNATVVINPYPSVQNVFGGGAICFGEEGKIVGLDNSEIGVRYVLLRNNDSIANVEGTGDSIVFGTFNINGTYTVRGVNTTNGLKKMMRGSAVIVVNPLPTVFTLVPTGERCPGTELYVNGSQSGFQYILFRNGSETDTIIGNGAWSILPFGPQYDTGYYWVRAVNPATGCGVWLNDTTRINPSPNVYHVIPAGILCQGQDVAIDASQTGIEYQLVRDETTLVGPVRNGTGGPISFGPQNYPGTYKVLATDPITLCAIFMADSAVLYPSPTVYHIMPSGDTCSPAIISLSGSQVGYNYGLYFNGEYPPIKIMTGTGNQLIFGTYTYAGTYTIKALNGNTQCENEMGGQLTLAPTPVMHNLLPNGYACVGQNLTLDNSQLGVSYQVIRNDSLLIGTPMVGTGLALNMGVALLPGSYRVIAYYPGSTCSEWMNGTAVIDPEPVTFSITPAGSQCSGVIIGLNGSEPSVQYRLIRDNLTSTPIAVLTGTGSTLSFGAQHLAGTYKIIAYRPISGCHTVMLDSVMIMARPVAYNVLPAGANCEPSVVSLSGSELGVTYTLLRDGMQLIPNLQISGTGTAISFGSQTAGTYTVMAAFNSSTCQSPMNGSSIISPMPVINPGADTLLCRGDLLQLNADVLNYQALAWSTSGNGTFSSNTIPNPVYTPGSADLANGQVYLVLAVTGTTPCPAVTVKDSLLVTFHPYPTINAGADQTICTGTNATLVGSGTNIGVTNWVSLGDGIFSDPSSLTSTYQPGALDKVNKLVNLVLVASGDQSCQHHSVSDTMTLHLEELPIAMAGNDTTVCESDDVWLHGSSYQGGSVAWTTSGDGTFSSAGTLNTLYTPGLADRTTGAVQLILTVNGKNTCALFLDRDTLVAHFDKLPSIEAGTDQSVCASTTEVMLHATSQNTTTVSWLSTGFGSFSPANSAVSTYHIASVDTTLSVVYLKIRAVGAGQCILKEANDSLALRFSPLPEAIAGNDTTVCNGSSIMLNGSGLHTQGYLWSSLGDGTFNTNSSASATYTPGLNDRSVGHVKLVLTAFGEGLCSTAVDKDTLNLDIKPLPTAILSGAGTVCEGEPVLMSVILTGTAPWSITLTNHLETISFNQIMSSPFEFSINPTISSSYSLTAVEDAFCSGTQMSGEVYVKVNPKPQEFLLLAPNGGYFCQGGAGIALLLDGSETGVSYQLLRGTEYVGAAVAGTGSPISFGTVSIPGFYHIIATNPLSLCHTDYPGGVQVIEYPSPDIDFITDTICNKQVFTFHIVAAHPEEIIEWRWNFGDGNVVTYNSATEPQHTYLTDGVFEVALSVTDLHGCTKEVKHFIKVLPSPVALFSSTYPHCINDSVSFTSLAYATAGDYIASWSWNFGDGNSSTILWPNDPNVKHPYSAAGVYPVTLMVVTQHGCEDTITREITIDSPPLANFVWSGACDNNNVQFTNQSQSSISGSVQEWMWNFGDPQSGIANTSIEENPLHQFTSSGTFTVTLTIMTANGCTDTISKVVTVRPAPLALFSADTACLNETTHFTSLATASTGAIATYDWDFGDGTDHSNLQNPVHTYAIAGNWDVTLTVTDEQGCTSDTTMSVVVSQLPIALFTASANGCTGSEVAFHNLSTATQGFISEWKWEFGDGQMQIVSFPTNPDVAHSYSVVGNYISKLTVTTSLGCKASYTQPVTVVPGPVANFTSSLTTCQDEVVQFTDISQSNGSGTILSRTWDFGDPLSGVLNTGTGVTSSHVFTLPGNYRVRLEIATSNGCTDTISKLISIKPSAVALFSADTACQGALTHFNDLSTVPGGSISQWSWNFGDGTPGSNLQNPTHQYTTDGVYLVSLSVMTTSNCWSDTVMPIVVRKNPVAMYSTSSQNCDGAPVTFNNLSTSTSGYITTWLWSFGDGSNQTVTAPDIPDVEHTYNQSGVYNSSLRVTTNYGCSAIKTLTVEVMDKPSANFSFTNSCAGMVTSFTDNSQAVGGSPLVSWQWDFGDPQSGVNNQSSSQNPTHVYTAGGEFTVVLIVQNANGCYDTIQKLVNVIEPPIASFTADSVCQGSPTQFTNTSTASGGVISTYLWTFGDGQQSNLVNPEHLYQNWGSYDVTLQITTDLGCMADTVKKVFVKPVPVVAFGWNGSCSGNAIAFTDQSTTPDGAITQWAWDFGDGTTSDLQAPDHVYSLSGSYIVTLTVTNSHGCSSILSQTINVKAKPDALFSANSVFCPEGLVSFQDMSTSLTSPIVSRLWDFGNGYSNTAANPNYTYPIVDSCYTVKLIVTNADGCADTSTKEVCVKPGFEFTMDVEPACSGYATAFAPVNLAAGDSLVYVTWNFGDPQSGFNNVSALRNPQHVYTEEGQYLVTLKAWNTNNCVDSVMRWVKIYKGPQVDFSWDDGAHCDKIITFTSDLQSFGVTIDSIQWSFGDGTVSQTTPGSVNLVSHEFTHFGEFLVTQSAFTRTGCMASISKTVKVKCTSTLFYTLDSLACQSHPVTFADSTKPLTGVVDWLWLFGDGEYQQYATYTPQIQHQFAAPGLYDVKLVTTTLYNGNTILDSLIRSVRVYATPKVDFIVSNLCANDSVLFKNQSTIDYGSIEGYMWEFGDDSISTKTSPSHLYTKGNQFKVVCVAVSDEGCIDSTSKAITLSMPPVVNLSPSDSVYCGFEDPIVLADTSGVLHDSYLWHFGDGQTETTTDSAVSHVYAPGEYVARLQVLDALSGCRTNAFSHLTIHPKPIAYFSFDPDSVPVADGKIYFRDESDSNGGMITNWSWSFGDGETSIDPIVTHRYLNSGVFNVDLLVTNKFGCTDTASSTVKILPEYIFFAPNAFSPNGDGLNDVFQPYLDGIIPEKYQLDIYNRWGQLVFQSSDYLQGWDGKVDGQFADVGAYVYFLKVTTNRNKETTSSGTFMLIK